MAPSPPYRLTSLDELDSVPLDHGAWRPIRRPLGITAFAINAYSADADEALIEPHDESSAGAGGHEELYYVATGSARFSVAGERLDAPSGTLLLVDPAARREATATSARTTVLVIGGRPGAALPPSPFEYWYTAIPAERAGDLAEAYATVAAGLDEWPGHGTIHYVLGALSARMGERDRALEHLRSAFAGDPRTRAWAAEDPDLDGIRDDPGFPD